MWQEHECLFDISNEMYHNRAEKEKRWTEIANALQQPGELTLNTVFKLGRGRPEVKNYFIFKIQLVRQHHITFSPLRLFNSSINSSISKYNNIRSLTFSAEPQRISQQPSASLLNDSVF